MIPSEWVLNKSHKIQWISCDSTQPQTPKREWMNRTGKSHGVLPGTKIWRFFLGEIFDETVGWIQSWHYGSQYFPSKLPIICVTWWLSNKNGSAMNWIHPWIYQTVFRLPVASCRFLDCFKMVLSLAEFFGCLNPSIETSHHSCDENQRRNPRKLHEPKEPKMIIVLCGFPITVNLDWVL